MYLLVRCSKRQTLYLPESYAGKLCENGEAVAYETDGGKAVFRFVSGVYELAAKI